MNFLAIVLVTLVSLSVGLAVCWDDKDWQQVGHELRARSDGFVKGWEGK